MPEDDNNSGSKSEARIKKTEQLELKVDFHYFCHCKGQLHCCAYNTSIPRKKCIGV